MHEFSDRKTRISKSMLFRRIFKGFPIELVMQLNSITCTVPLMQLNSITCEVPLMQLNSNTCTVPLMQLNSITCTVPLIPGNNLGTFP